MPKPAARFDAESVRASWDDAADIYAEGQASGRDYYRYEFFGPAQLGPWSTGPTPAFRYSDH